MTNGRFIRGSFLARMVWLLGVPALVILSSCTGAPPTQDETKLLGEKVNVFVAKDAISGLKKQADRIGTVTFAKTGLKIDALEGSSIVALRLANKSMADHLADQKIKVDAKWLGEQGFQISTTKQAAGNLIAITANTDVGLYYGLLELAGKLSGTKKIEDLSVNMKDRPVFELRAGFPEKRGNIVFFDGEEIFDFTMFTECFDGDKKLLEKYKLRTAARRKELRALLEKARSCGQKIFVHTYEAHIPMELRDNFFRAHPEARSSLYDHKISLCPSAEITKKFVYERYRELFASFPDLAGVRLTLGDCGASLKCECDRCKKYPFQQRVVDYAGLVFKAIRVSNPRARVMLRSWFISRHCDFAGLQDVLPDGVFYCSKLTSPPGSDNLWKDNFSPYVGKIRRYAALGVGSFVTAHDGVPHFLYDGFRYKRRCERLARAGVIGVPGGSIYWGSKCVTKPASEARYVCAWNPFRFDPEAFLKEWTAEKFGPRAGRCVYLALKDTEKIRDDLILKDMRSESFHMYFFFPRRNDRQNGYHPPRAETKWKYSYASPTIPQTPEVYDVTTDTLKKLEKRLSFPRALSIAKEACRQMDAAREIRPDNKDILRLHKLAHTELALVEFLRNYHLALLYYNLAYNEPGRFKDMRPRVDEHLKTAKEKVLVYASGVREIVGKPLPHTANPFMYVASMTQQVHNAYDEIVVAGEPEQKYEIIRRFTNRRKGVSLQEKWTPAKKRLQKNWTRPDGKADFPVGAESDRNPPEVVAPDILPEINITFKDDIPQGALVRIVYEPLGTGYMRRQAEVDVILDGVKIGRIEQFAHKWTMWGEPRFIRCFKIAAASGGATHKLTLRATGGTGIYLRQISLEKPAGK